MGPYKLFLQQFENYAREVVAVARQNVNSSFTAIESFAVTISSFAASSNMTWPFVTVPNFAARADRLTKETKGFLVSMAPLVQADQRQEWDDYSLKQMPAMYQDAINYEGLNRSAEELVNATRKDIWYYKQAFNAQPDPVIDTSPGPWLVMWSLYPQDQVQQLPPTNLNIFSGQRSQSIFYTTESTLQPTFEFVEVQRNRFDCQVFQPIFEAPPGGKHSNSGDAKVVGILFVLIDWIFYFQNLLRSGANGIVVAMTSSCTNMTLTYQIDGLAATYVGLGDLHDHKYDYMEVTAPFLKFNVDPNRIPNGECIPDIALHIYPSQTLEDSFKTNNAAIYTTVVVLIFVFTSLVFVLYDFFVNRRQAKVMARIVRQDKIVSNLFPTAIRDRLYESNSAEDLRQRKADIDPDDFDNNEIFSASPLADLFPAVTVVFADISGFTAWSSTREPPQVFLLLEAIYSAFDKIAYRTGVFKVRTSPL